MKEWAVEGGRLKLFYLMREALAPLVEAILLVDRAISLAERMQPPPLMGQGQGQQAAGVVRLFPLFDPALSPRNICLFASAPSPPTTVATQE